MIFVPHLHIIPYMYVIVIQSLVLTSCAFDVALLSQCVFACIPRCGIGIMTTTTTDKHTAIYVCYVLVLTHSVA